MHYSFKLNSSHHMSGSPWVHWRLCRLGWFQSDWYQRREGFQQGFLPIWIFFPNAPSFYVCIFSWIMSDQSQPYHQQDSFLNYGGYSTKSIAVQTLRVTKEALPEIPPRKLTCFSHTGTLRWPHHSIRSAWTRFVVTFLTLLPVYRPSPMTPTKTYVSSVEGEKTEKYANAIPARHISPRLIFTTLSFVRLVFVYFFSVSLN